jgi:hypothetical protein
MFSGVVPVEQCASVAALCRALMAPGPRVINVNGVFGRRLYGGRVRSLGLLAAVIDSAPLGL